MRRRMRHWATEKPPSRPDRRIIRPRLPQSVCEGETGFIRGKKAQMASLPGIRRVKIGS